MSKQIRVWEIEWRDAADSDSVYDRQNVVARTAAEALVKAKPKFEGSRIATSIKLIATAMN